MNVPWTDKQSCNSDWSFLSCLWNCLSIAPGNHTRGISVNCINNCKIYYQVLGLFHKTSSLLEHNIHVFGEILEQYVGWTTEQGWEKVKIYWFHSHNAIVEETFHTELLDKTFKFGLQNTLWCRDYNPQESIYFLGARYSFNWCQWLHLQKFYTTKQLKNIPPQQDLQQPL